MKLLRQPLDSTSTVAFLALVGLGLAFWLSSSVRPPVVEPPLPAPAATAPSHYDNCAGGPGCDPNWTMESER